MQLQERPVVIPGKDHIFVFAPGTFIRGLHEVNSNADSEIDLRVGIFYMQLVFTLT